MTERVLDLTAEQLKTEIKPYADEFIVHGDNYDALSRDSRELAYKGAEAAIHVPAVKFIVDTTLKLLTRPEFDDDLPLEVYERQGIASMTAERIAEIAVEEGYFAAYYATDTYLSPETGLPTVTSARYLGVLGGAPFADTRIVAGGALKLLKMGNIKQPAEVIKWSRDLSSVSMIDKGKAKLVEQFLGTPYANIDHFKGRKTEKGLELAFTESTREALKLLRGIGCPAGRIALAGAGGPTLLQEYWCRIVDYLLPVDATVNGFPTE